jgi:hypothetical protein
MKKRKLKCEMIWKMENMAKTITTAAAAAAATRL